MRRTDAKGIRPSFFVLFAYVGMPSLTDPKTGRVQNAYTALRRKGLYANVLNYRPVTAAGSKSASSQRRGAGISGPRLGGRNNPNAVVLKALGRF